MKKYNKIYSSSNISREIKPSQILSLVWKNFLPGSQILDLGCGQGADSLFLAKNKFLVTAIDSSQVAIDQIETIKNEQKLNNLKLICSNIKKIDMPNNKYGVIICHNVLSFLDKKEALNIINKIKNGLKNKGFIIISGFTKNDPSFHSNNKLKNYFEEQELLKIFNDFKILYYLENIILDPGHIGFLSPHKHGITKIIAQKQL